MNPPPVADTETEPASASTFCTCASTTLRTSLWSIEAEVASRAAGQALLAEARADLAEHGVRERVGDQARRRELLPELEVGVVLVVPRSTRAARVPIHW